MSMPKIPKSKKNQPVPFSWLKLTPPVLFTFAVGEVYYWHFRGVACVILLIAAAIAHIEANKPKPHVLNIVGTARIVKHMNDNLTDPAEQMESIISFLDLTRSGASKRGETLEEIVRERGLHAVCEGLVQHPQESSFVVPAYQLLYRVLGAPESKKAALASFNEDSLMGSVLAPLHTWMAAAKGATKEKPPEPTLFVRGLMVLGALADGNPEMQDGAAELGVPEAIAASLELVAKWEEVHEKVAPIALRTLLHVCYRHGEAKNALVVRADGVRRLLRSLTLVPAHVETQLQGLGVLYDCMQEVPDVDMRGLRHHAVDAGALPVLKSALESFPQVQTIADTARQLQDLLQKVAAEPVEL